jgi:hypothetical protein
MGLSMLPDFIIIGVHKAGTTSLHHYFDQHGHVFMTLVKEPNYFSFDPHNPRHIGQSKDQFRVRSLDQYEKLFKDAPPDAKKGEASPSYFQSQLAPERINKTIDNCKLILSLRNPVDRAYSAYQMSVRRGRASVTVDQIDPSRDRWITAGFYAESLSRYQNYFNEDRLKVILFDELRNDPALVMRELFRFIDVDETFPINTAYNYNPGGLPRNRGLHRALSFLKQVPGLQEHSPKVLRRGLAGFRDRNLHKAQPLRPEIRARWLVYLREDILRTQDLIQRDLSHWLAVD